MALLIGELGFEIGANELPRQFDADDPRTEYEYVHVVVLDALVGRVGVVTQSCADSVYFVGGHGCADPAATNQHAAVSFTLLDGCSQKKSEVGIVIQCIISAGAEINDLVAKASDQVCKLVL